MLTGSSVSQEIAKNDFVPNEFTKADFILYDSKQQSQISIGMKREEVEKNFGKHIDTIDFLGHYIYDGFKVHYKDNKVNAIIIDDTTDKNQRLQTARSTQYGSPYSEVIEKYGSFGIIDESDDNISLTYIVEFENGEYVAKKSRSEVHDKQSALTISANFYNKDKLSFLMIADYFYSYPDI